MREYTILLIGAELVDTIYIKRATTIDVIHEANDELYSAESANVAVVRDPEFNLIYTAIKAAERRLS